MTTLPEESGFFESLKDADKYRAAIVAALAPQLKGRVLEVGAGVGQLTEIFRTLPNVSEVVAVEPHPEFCSHIRERLPGQRVIQGTSADVSEKNWDAIVNCNVLEHIEDDLAELKRYQNLLKERQGTLVMFLPARQELFSPLDEVVGHFRRYTKKDLRTKIKAAGFTIEQLYYFDFVGYFGWLARFVIFRARTQNYKAVQLFDRLIVPWESWLESHVCHPPIGKNLVLVAHPKV